MKFRQHYSGSNGNLYEITANNGKRLIIDPGIIWSSDKTNRNILTALNHNLSGIEGCFISHEHADHSKGAKGVRKAGIDIYASAGTLKKAKIGTGRRIHVVKNGMTVKPKHDNELKSFEVYCFDTIHDAKQPLGFVVRERATGEYLLFATDTKTIRQKFPYAFSIIAIELSYNGPYLKKKVEAGEIDEGLAKRLLDSHMEESETLNYLQNSCDLSQCGQVHLLHLSASNVHKQRLVKKFQEQLFTDVITV